eukprot:scaffold81788_cov45-Attheya_sp.AAC.1
MKKTTRETGRCNGDGGSDEGSGGLISEERSGRLFDDASGTDAGSSGTGRSWLTGVGQLPDAMGPGRLCGQGQTEGCLSRVILDAGRHGMFLDQGRNGHGFARQECLISSASERRGPTGHHMKRQISFQIGFRDLTRVRSKRQDQKYQRTFGNARRRMQNMKGRDALLQTTHGGLLVDLSENQERTLPHPPCGQRRRGRRGHMRPNRRQRRSNRLTPNGPSVAPRVSGCWRVPLRTPCAPKWLPNCTRKGLLAPDSSRMHSSSQERVGRRTRAKWGAWWRDCGVTWLPPGGGWRSW